MPFKTRTELIKTDYLILYICKYVYYNMYIILIYDILPTMLTSVVLSLAQ